MVRLFSLFGSALSRGAHDMQIEVNIAVIMLSLILLNYYIYYQII
ncbi:hypothetical protein QIA00_05175 (plasmid) [Borreliella americana]|uniref:Uncharacterized protein n=1 Tax=Borreliella americana TaxID=478807 RepID=A0ACD5G854_9SPIR